MSWNWNKETGVGHHPEPAAPAKPKAASKKKPAGKKPAARKKA